VVREKALDLLEQGIAAAKAGDKARARLILLEATERNPESESAWLWLAGVAESLEETVLCLQRVLEINPDNARAKKGLAWARAQASEQPARMKQRCPLCPAGSKGASGECETCNVVLNLTDIDALLNNTEVDRKKLYEAIGRYEDAAIYDTNFEAHYNLGLAYLNLHEIDKGIKHLQAAVRLKPDDKALRAQVGALMQRLAADQAARKKEQKELPTRGSVLVVDDSPTVRKLVSITLKRHNYRVITAADGLEALSELKTDLPDLVLLDITMPRMDGYKVCKMIKGNDATKHLPVVMLSGKDGFFDKMRGRMAGSTEYITKPFEPDTLIDVVTKHAGNSQGATR
jgi:twitching motility two-component system response regulator PilG